MCKNCICVYVNSTASKKKSMYQLVRATINSDKAIKRLVLALATFLQRKLFLLENGVQVLFFSRQTGSTRFVFRTKFWNNKILSSPGTTAACEYMCVCDGVCVCLYVCVWWRVCVYWHIESFFSIAVAKFDFSPIFHALGSWQLLPHYFADWLWHVFRITIFFFEIFLALFFRIRIWIIGGYGVYNVN